MPRPGQRAATRGPLGSSAPRSGALPALALLLATLLSGPAAAQQIGAWTPSIGAFGHWTWGLPRADEATIEALSPSPPRCYQAIAEGSVCCSTGAAWVCGGSSGGGPHTHAAADIISGTFADALVDGSLEGDELVLAGDVDGTANANDLDEAAVRDELETVLRLAALQGLLLEAQAPAALARDTETCTGGACTVGTDDNLTLAQSATPAPTVEGRIEWDTDDDRLAVGNGAGGTTVFHSGPHTVDTDTTCLDAGVNCLFAGSSSEGGPATTATALAANGANCSAGNAPLGVDASGAAEGCFDVATQTELNALDTTADDLSNNDLGDLGNVTETGEAAGRALVGDGAGNWQPSADEVCLQDGTNCPAGGANPAGSGSELQHRSSGSAFGAVTGSSTANGGIGLVSQSAAEIPLRVTGASGQTASLTLWNGPPLTVTSITRSGSTATVTLSAATSPLYSRTKWTISGADQSEYNGTFTVTATSSSSFTYTVSGSPATPATGTIKAARAIVVAPDGAISFHQLDFGAGALLTPWNSDGDNGNVGPRFNTRVSANDIRFITLLDLNGNWSMTNTGGVAFGSSPSQIPICWHGDTCVTRAAAGSLLLHGGNFAATGDAQTTWRVLRRSTTDATPTELFLNGSSARMALANDTTWTFACLVTARRTDADGESAGYKLEGVIDRQTNAASTALVGSVTQTVLAEDNAGWDVTATADTTNGALVLTVTGEASKTIRWVASCQTAETTG